MDTFGHYRNFLVSETEFTPDVLLNLFNYNVPPSNQDLTGDQNLPDNDTVPPSNQDLTGDQNLPDDDMMLSPSNQNTAASVHSEDDFNDDQISISHEEGTCPSLNLSENLREDIVSSWEKSLIVKLFNRSVKHNVLLEHITNKWSPRGEWELIDLHNGFFVVKFLSSDGMNYVFNEGPWIILGDYLTIQKWRPGIHTSSGSLLPSTATAAWVRFPDLPIEYCHNHKLLWALGNKIGTVILVDPKTRFAPKRRFARVCVEIDLSKDVITEYKLEGVLHRVEYEHLKVDGGKVRGVCKVQGDGRMAFNWPQPVQPGLSRPAHSLARAQPIIESATVQTGYGLYMHMERK